MAEAHVEDRRAISGFPRWVRLATTARMGWGGTLLLVMGTAALAIGLGLHLFGSSRTGSQFALGWGAFAICFAAVLFLSFSRKPFFSVVDMANNRGRLRR